MTTLTLVNAASTRSRAARVYWMEAKAEVLKMLRLPAYALPSIAFPLVFYILFGVIFGAGRAAGTITMGTYLLGSYGAFGVIGAALFGFGVGVAVERGQGWMLLKRASPMPPLAYFVAKMFLCLVFAALITGSLFVLGATVGGADLPARSWALLGFTLIAGAIPFCAFGLVLGYLAGPNSAPAIVNLIYLPMGFLSGLWFPLPMMPKAVQALAPALPAYHLGQLAFKVLGAGDGGSVSGHLAYLTVFTIACLALARYAFQRDEDRTFG